MENYFVPVADASGSLVRGATPIRIRALIVHMWLLSG